MERPTHPMRLDGFPGAPIADGLFPLPRRATWVFRDALDDGAKPLRLELREGRLSGVKEGVVAEIVWNDGFLEIHYEGRLVERLLKREGSVGDSWVAAGARCTVFGYDEVDVLERKARALVVSVQRGDRREIYWFAEGMGWVRIRTEQSGRVLRDARLVEYQSADAMN